MEKMIYLQINKGKKTRKEERNEIKKSRTKVCMEKKMHK